MCGVFGFVSRNGSAPDLRLLANIARETETRGRDAFGFAWVDTHDRIHSYKQTGRISDHLGVLNFAAHARVLIGHCRFSTHGDPRYNVNNHPHPCDGGWIVHNGVIRNYDRLIEDYNLSPTSRCDSEVLGLLVEQLDGSYEDRILSAARLAKTGPMAVLALWRDRMYALRSGNPLHVAESDEAFYLASLSGSLPVGSYALRDDTLLRFRIKRDRVTMTAFDASCISETVS
jgi:glutamine---fructose-6-phosphate transaminase (isomerizing)